MPRPDGSPAGPGRHMLGGAGSGCSAATRGYNVAPKVEATL